MLNLYRLIELLVTLQSIIISTMLPVYIPLPFIGKTGTSYEIPITWQIPTVIVLILLFNSKVVFKAFTIYIILGLFLFPVFPQGGSIGYLLTPNFGYLLGIFPLIKIIDNLNKYKINTRKFLFNGILAITSMHITGIIYNLIQIIYYREFNVFLYNLGRYSTGKIGYHIIMLIPIMLLIKPINNLKYKK